jgi:hypothetical protein
VYASRGNDQETNSTSLKIHLSSYQISKKFSYCGNSPLKLYISKKDLADSGTHPELISVVEQALITSKSGNL